RIGVPRVDQRVEPSGARPLVEHAEVDLVELDVDPHGAKLLLQEARVLTAHGAGRGHEQPEGERMRVAVADPVPVGIGPAQPRERPRGARAVVRELAGLGVPGTGVLRHRAGRDLGMVAENYVELYSA